MASESFLSHSPSFYHPTNNSSRKHWLKKLSRLSALILLTLFVLFLFTTHYQLLPSVIIFPPFRVPTDDVCSIRENREDSFWQEKPESWNLSNDSVAYSNTLKNRKVVKKKDFLECRLTVGNHDRVVFFLVFLERVCFVFLAGAGTAGFFLLFGSDDPK